MLTPENEGGERQKVACAPRWAKVQASAAERKSRQNLCRAWHRTGVALRKVENQRGLAPEGSQTNQGKGPSVEGVGWINNSDRTDYLIRHCGILFRAVTQSTRSIGSGHRQWLRPWGAGATDAPSRPATVGAVRPAAAQTFLAAKLSALLPSPSALAVRWRKVCARVPTPIGRSPWRFSTRR